MLIDKCPDGYLESVRRHAMSIGMLGQLNKQLAQLAAGDGNRCTLYKDFAPYSFYFVMEIRDENGEWQRYFNGGLIFHGKHDRGGDGGAPTFSVNLTPVDGWAVHT